MEIKAKQIDLVKVKDLKRKKNNRNHHPQEQIEALVEHYKYQGFRNPLIVSNQSGEVVCGNGRLLAAIRAGLKEVPVIYQDFDNSDQEYAYHVADNGLSLWAELDLAGINEDLADLGPDFNIDMLGIKDFVLDVSEIDLPELKTEEPGFQQITFVLSNEQKDILDEALEKAKKEEDCSDELNQNKNGNVLTAILKRYVYG